MNGNTIVAQILHLNPNIFIIFFPSFGINFIPQAPQTTPKIVKVISIDKRNIAKFL